MADTLLEQIDDDLDVKYDTTLGFAETVTGPAGAIPGIFGAEFYAADAGGTATVSTAQPMLRTRAADAIARGASVTIRSVAYLVIERRPNGYGEVIHALQVA